MAYVNFEEKEFEALLNADLVMGAAAAKGGAPKIFSPGQVLEAELGFDFSIHLPAMSRISRLIRGRFPSSKGITPNAASQAQLPPSVHGSFLNLFLQYKRPQVFHPGHRSPLYDSGTTFLRFEVSQRKLLNGAMQRVHTQVAALDKLESSFKGDASVQYVCPSTHTQDALYQSFANGRLLNESVFVPPSQLRLQASAGYHDYWTFKATTLGIGIPNPDGPPGTSKNGLDFLTELSYLPKKSRSGIREFTRYAAEATEEFRKLPVWEEQEKTFDDSVLREERISRELAMGDLEEFDPMDAKTIAETVETASLARALGLTWVIVEM